MDPTLAAPLPPLPDADRPWALFLDLDGTLAELMPHPDDVIIPTDTKSAVEELFGRLDGALAIVSGRPIAQIDRLFAPSVMPAAGLHGLERRFAPGGRIERAATPQWRDSVISAVSALTDDIPGAWLEDKDVTLALHYRGAPDREADIREVTREIESRDLADMSVQHGKFIVEFRPVGANKGDAILTFSQTAPFRGRRLVFVGDDITDEHGFAAVRQHDGLAIRVGPAKDTAAEWLLPTVRDAQEWIQKVNQTMQPTGSRETR